MIKQKSDSFNKLTNAMIDVEYLTAKDFLEDAFSFIKDPTFREEIIDSIDNNLALCGLKSMFLEDLKPSEFLKFCHLDKFQSILEEIERTPVSELCFDPYYKTNNTATNFLTSSVCKPIGDRLKLDFHNPHDREMIEKAFDDEILDKYTPIYVEQTIARDNEGKIIDVHKIASPMDWIFLEEGIYVESTVEENGIRISGLMNEIIPLNDVFNNIDVLAGGSTAFNVTLSEIKDNKLDEIIEQFLHEVARDLSEDVSKYDCNESNWYDYTVSSYTPISESYNIGYYKEYGICFSKKKK